MFAFEKVINFKFAYTNDLHTYTHTHIHVKMLKPTNWVIKYIIYIQKLYLSFTIANDQIKSINLLYVNVHYAITRICLSHLLDTNIMWDVQCILEKWEKTHELLHKKITRWTNIIIVKMCICDTVKSGRKCRFTCVWLCKFMSLFVCFTVVFCLFVNYRSFFLSPCFNYEDAKKSPNN